MMNIEKMIDNAAAASQNDFDDVTREAIMLNIITPLQTRMARLESILRRIRNDSVHSQSSSLCDIIDGAL